MARKAARLERAGALTPRDRMWAAIRALSGALFSPVEVQFLTNLRAPAEAQAHVASVVDYLQGLAKAEPPYVAPASTEQSRDGRKRNELVLYRLVRDVGVDAPRVTADGKPVVQGIGNERMWRSMKVLREFDHGELAIAATDAAHQVSAETAKTYCTYLCRAGYLALVAPAMPGHAKARYRFIRAKNTGPRAPLITKTKEVMDANTGAVVQPRGDKGCKGQT